MKKNILMLCALMFNALHAMQQNITLPIIAQQQFMNIQQTAALKQQDIWKDQTEICVCSGEVPWQQEYTFNETGTYFKIPLCHCDHRSLCAKNAIFNIDTSSLSVQELTDDQVNHYGGNSKKKLLVEINYYNNRFCRSSSNLPSLHEKNNGQVLAWHNKGFLVAGKAQFAPENQDDALFLSNKNCIGLEHCYNLPEKMILICLAEPKAKFFEKLNEPQGGILYSVRASQATLMAYLITINASNKFQSDITCLGEIKSYKHVPDNSYLYVRTCTDEQGNIKVACGDKQGSFLDVFNVTVTTLPTALLHVMKTNIMPNKKSHDVRFCYA